MPACEIPAGVKLAAETSPASLPEADATGEAPGWWFWGASCAPEMGMEMPGEEEGEKLGMKRLFHAQPQQEPEEKSALGSRNPPWEDLQGFIIYFNVFFWIWGETLLTTNISALTAEFPW